MLPLRVGGKELSLTAKLLFRPAEPQDQFVSVSRPLPPFENGGGGDSGRDGGLCCGWC